MRFMRLFWVLVLSAVLPLALAGTAFAQVELQISLAYEMSYDASFVNSAVLPNVAVPGDSASLTQVSLTPGGLYVNHIFGVYASVTRSPSGISSIVAVIRVSGAGMPGMVRARRV